MRFRKQPDKILMELGIYEPKEIDLDLVAFSLNAQVKRVPLDESEGSIIGTDEKAIITVDSNAKLVRQRFSLGHEIGHWVNDKGKNLTFRCSTADMRQRAANSKNSRAKKEARANQFSAELLMPAHMLKRFLMHTDINLEIIDFLANTFRVSRTSAAIRFVEMADAACMLICWDKYGQRRWFTRSKNIPEYVWPIRKLDEPNFTLIPSNGVEVDADKWAEYTDAVKDTVIESVFSNGYDIFTLLWWENETPFCR